MTEVSLSRYRQAPAPDPMQDFDARIGDNVMLLRGGGGYSFHKVLNREIVTDVQKDIKTTDFPTTAFPVAGGAELSLGNLSEFLEPAPRVLLILRFGIDSNVPINVRVFHGGTTANIGGIKNQDEGYCTPMNTPYRHPRFIITSYGDKMTPSFRVSNPMPVTTGFAIRWIKFKFFGHQLYLSPPFGHKDVAAFESPSHPYHDDFYLPNGDVIVVPDRYKTITLRHIIEAGD